MPIAINERQKEELNGQGFTVIQDVLDRAAVDRVSRAMDEVADQIRELRGLPPDASLSLRNSISRHEVILGLIDHPLILPLVVDVVGWNIQNRDSIFDYKAPLPPDADPEKMSLGWHFDYEEELAGTTVDSCMPLLDGGTSRTTRKMATAPSCWCPAASAGTRNSGPRGNPGWIPKRFSSCGSALEARCCGAPPCSMA